MNNNINNNNNQIMANSDNTNNIQHNTNVIENHSSNIKESILKKLNIIEKNIEKSYKDNNDKGLVLKK